MRVVIVGAGFGGYTLARKLAGQRLDVLVVDRNNYHLFTPLLYQVASSLLNPSDIAFPIRKGLSRAGNLRVRLAEVTGVDFDGRCISTSDGVSIRYDRLVLATGSKTSFFGMARVERAALGLKDLPEALQLRNHVLSRFEEASRTEDPLRRKWALTFVVVGGGPTGVEYAGALSELVRLNLGRDFPELDLAEVRIVLVELADRVLGMFSEPLSTYARQELERRGIELRLGTRVTDADGDQVEFAEGEPLSAGTLVWAAGVGPAEFESPLPSGRSGSGRVVVDEYLRVDGQEDVYAIGDLASFEHEGVEVPMLAPPAMQQARLLAGNFVRELAGKPPQPFCYKDKGVMATIGRSAAVTEAGRLRLTGLIGWLGWLTLHLFYIICARSRVLILFQWAWEYVRYDRPIRIITRAKADEDTPRGRRPS
jgi:NADH:quinone reductase (non-electrogenic)